MSVLKSIVQIQKEQLNLGEKVLKTLQNVVINPNVNHTFMNNAPVVPCSNSAPTPSSNHDPPQYWLSSLDPVPLLPSAVSIEPDAPEEDWDFEIDPEPTYVDYANIEKRSTYQPDQFVDPLVEWGAQPVGAQYNPIIDIGGYIMTPSQSTSMRLARICHRVLVEAAPMCRRTRPVCHVPCSSCLRICRPGIIVCNDIFSRWLSFKMVCEQIWKLVPTPRLIYPEAGYVPQILDPDIEPNDSSIEKESECCSDSDDDDEDSPMSEQVYAPEIFTPKHIDYISRRKEFVHC